LKHDKLKKDALREQRERETAYRKFILELYHAAHLKLSGKSLGLLINFNVVHLKDGIRRFVNGGLEVRATTTKDTKLH
jgi:hypothetical protein